MLKNNLTTEDIKDGKELFDIVTNLDEMSKMMVLVYAGALRDKQMMEQQAS